MTNKPPIHYQVNLSTFSVVYGDITKTHADVIVSSDDNLLSMGGGVSFAIKQAAGEDYYQNTRTIPRLYLGDVYESIAGHLSAKKVFHIITIDRIEYRIIDITHIKNSVYKALHLCETHGYRSIAFPALATGAAGASFEDVAHTMTHTIADYLTTCKSSLQVTITLFARPGITQSQLNQFYDKSVVLSVQLGLSQSLDILLSEIITLTNRSELIPARESVRHVISNHIQSTINPMYTHAPEQMSESINFIHAVIAKVNAQDHHSPQTIHAEIKALQMLLNQLYYESQFALFGANQTNTQKIREYEERLRILKQLIEHQ